MKNLDEIRNHNYEYLTNDSRINEIFEKGIEYEIVIDYKERTEDTLLFWGWEFIIFKSKKAGFKIEFKDKLTKIEEINENLSDLESHLFNSLSDTKLFSILRNNIHINHLKEDYSIENREKPPINGWKSFNETKAIDNFEKSFRSLIRYYEWVVEKKCTEDEFIYNILFRNSAKESAKELRRLYEKIIRWRIINLIFYFNENVKDSTSQELIDFTIYRALLPFKDQIRIAREILLENNLKFDIIEDIDTYTLMLSRSDVPQEGRDIAKQGHGIRTLVVVLLASLFGNFLLLDEPENGLHISLQEDLIRYLIGASYLQIFIVSQSPSIISYHPECNTFLVDKGKIKNIMLYPDKWIDYNHFIKRNMNELRQILGVNPQNMLFAKSLLIFEGRTDISFYADIFFEPGVLLHRADGVENLKSTWHIYHKIMKENIMENITFLFDRDYFNDIIANIDEENAFTLPCYSFENLFFDPFFLSQTLGVEEMKIRETLLELLDNNEKTDTLNKLFIVHLFHNIEGIAKEALDTLKRQINWDEPEIEKLHNIIEGYWTQEENISKDDVDNSIKKINGISLNWDKTFIYFVEMKKKAKWLIKKLTDKFLKNQQNKETEQISVSSLKYRYKEFIKEKWDDSSIPDSLFKDFICMCKKIRNKLNISLDIKR